MANAHDKVVCGNCKGTFFTVSHAEQFVAGGYGSAEFRSLSNAPKTVLICIGCSTPITPKPAFYGKGTTADVAEQDFRKSVEVGQKYRKDNSVHNIATIAVSPKELQDVRELVEDIKRVVEAKDKSIKPKQEVKKAVKAERTFQLPPSESAIQ